MRSAETAKAPSMRPSSGGSAPRSVLGAAAAQAAEAVGLCVAIVSNIIDSASGQSGSTTSNETAFIVLEVIVVIGVAWVATGLARVRPWSRTPAVITQVLTVVIAIALLQAHRYGWGIPALLLAVAGFAGLFAPPSLRALNHPRGPSPR